ncbi:hypothetical protein ACQP0C_19350 [Nocardia sp. CA-129566]
MSYPRLITRSRPAAAVLVPDVSMFTGAALVAAALLAVRLW